MPDMKWGEMGGLIDDGVCRALQMSAGNLSMKYFFTVCVFFLSFLMVPV